MSSQVAVEQLKENRWLRNIAIIAAGGVLSVFVVRRLAVASFGSCRRKEYYFKNKSVVITGGTTPIGTAIAENLVKRGACVVITSADEKEGNKTADDIKKKYPDGIIRFQYLQLRSFDSILLFCDDLEHYDSVLHVLICADMLQDQQKYAETEEGFELHMGQNFYGHLLLINRLQRLLQASKPSRVVMVIDDSYVEGGSFIDELLQPETNRFIEANCKAKSYIACVLLVREYAINYHDSGVTIYAACCEKPPVPYHKKTSLQKAFTILFYPLTLLFYKSIEHEAQNVLECAIGDRTAEHSGEIYKNCKAIHAPISFSMTTIENFWESSVAIVTTKLKDNFLTLDAGFNSPSESEV